LLIPLSPERNAFNNLRICAKVPATPPAARSAFDSGANPESVIPTTSEPEAVTRRFSLLWWVYLTNAAVLVIALILLTLTPITIDAPIALSQLLLLLTGMAALLVVNFLLLRRVLSPFIRLTTAMSAVDPDAPGRRLTGVNPRATEGAALVNAFNGMLDRLENARREAARAALSAQEAERLRVSQELHDEIGQTLTAVMLEAERATGTEPARASQALGRVAHAVRDSLDEVRRIARELRPEALDDLGLVNALIALCSRMDTQGDLRVRRDLQGTLPNIQPEVELVIYRVAQESLSNVLRHADADTATVSLRSDAQSLVLSVTDNGTGMPPEVPHGTAGITGMRERALLVGGRLSIESQSGEGTEVRLVIPIEAETQ
jgi:two-component system sensor histidine kinase UhpB